MLKPFVSQSCIVLGIISNGHDRQPAIISAVWGEEKDPATDTFKCNMTVLPDCGAPVCLNSVPMFETEAQAQAARAGQVDASAPVAYFPWTIGVSAVGELKSG